MKADRGVTGCLHFSVVKVFGRVTGEVRISSTLREIQLALCPLPFPWASVSKLDWSSEAFFFYSPCPCLGFDIRV